MNFDWLVIWVVLLDLMDGVWLMVFIVFFGLVGGFVVGMIVGMFCVYGLKVMNVFV